MWRAVNDLTEDQLCALANVRATCLLSDGSEAQLVFWPGSGPRVVMHQGQRARVSFSAGDGRTRQRTVATSSVVAVWDHLTGDRL